MTLDPVSHPSQILLSVCLRVIQKRSECGDSEEQEEILYRRGVSWWHLARTRIPDTEDLPLASSWQASVVRLAYRCQLHSWMAVELYSWMAVELYSWMAVEPQVHTIKKLHA